VDREETGKEVGWVPAGDGPEDQWHREAFEPQLGLPDGTYELVGPSIQGNAEHYEQNTPRSLPTPAWHGSSGRRRSP